MDINARVSIYLQGTVKYHPGTVNREDAITFLNKGSVGKTSAVNCYRGRILQPKFSKVITPVCSAAGKIPDLVVITDIKSAGIVNQNGI